MHRIQLKGKKHLHYVKHVPAEMSLNGQLGYHGQSAEITTATNRDYLPSCLCIASCYSWCSPGRRALPVVCFISREFTDTPQVLF